MKSVHDAPGNTGPETFTAAELMGLELPPVRWTVPGIVPEGLILLAGKPKLGKSWLAFGLAVAVASGGVALGKIPVERGEVLYLALEDNQRRLQKRLAKLLTDGKPPEGLHIATRWPRMDDGGAEALERWLLTHPDTALIVVDVLKRVRPRSSRNQALYDADYESLEAMQALAAEHGISVLVVHHTRKAGADDPMDEISGSLGLSGNADGALVLKRDRGRGDAYLHADGRDFEQAAELALMWDADLASWKLAGDAEEFRISRERAAVLRVLEEANEPMRPTEVADALEKSVGSTKKLLWSMSKDGQVSSADGGYSTVGSNSGNPVTSDEGNGYHGYRGYPVTTTTEVTSQCSHGYPGGVGCSLHDPDLPSRRSVAKEPRRVTSRPQAGEPAAHTGRGVS